MSPYEDMDEIVEYHGRSVERVGAVVLAALAVVLFALGITLNVMGRPAGFTIIVVAAVDAVLAFGLWVEDA